MKKAVAGILVLSVLLVFNYSISVDSNTNNPPPSQLAPLVSIQDAFVKIARNATPAVVNISTTQVIQGESVTNPFRDFFNDDFFNRFFDAPRQREYKRSNLGSGVIIDKRGYILTNNHVVQGAQEITVTLSDKRTFKGKVVGTDPKTDIAVIKIDADNLTPIAIGDSDKLEVGQWAIAIGNPFVLTQTVTTGIISAKGRSDIGIVDYEDFIQTDAAINPGNSGGALLNINGELIGINTAIFSRSGGYQGIGFAIPVNMAKSIMSDLIKHGKIQRGWLGVNIQKLDEKLAKQFQLKNLSGVLIAEVFEDSPAEKAGIKRGDVIIRYNGKDVDDPTELRNLVATTEVGKKVDILLLRNGKELTVKATVAKQKDSEVAMLAAAGKLGIEIKDNDGLLKKQQGGVVITKVLEGSDAETAGLKPGDRIVELNRTPIENIETFNELVKNLTAGDRALLLIQREKMAYYVVLEVKQ